MKKTKIKLPRRVTLAGKVYRVSTSVKEFGGKGNTGEQILLIGTAGQADDIWDTFLHEAIECIMLERGNRYDDNGRLRFVMDHDEFQNLIADIAVMLWPLVKDRLEAKP